jgi:hypothetical protein
MDLSRTWGNVRNPKITPTMATFGQKEAETFLGTHVSNSVVQEDRRGSTEGCEVMVGQRPEEDEGTEVQLKELLRMRRVNFPGRTVQSGALLPRTLKDGQHPDVDEGTEFQFKELLRVRRVQRKALLSGVDRHGRIVQRKALLPWRLMEGQHLEEDEVTGVQLKELLQVPRVQRKALLSWIDLREKEVQLKTPTPWTQKNAVAPDVAP